MVANSIAQRWLRVDLAVDPELTEALADFMTGIGADGVCQEALMPLAEEAEEALRYETLTAHFPLENKENVLVSLESYLDTLSRFFPASPRPTLTIKDITDPDWGEEWKKYFHPFRLGKRFVIKPTWEPYEPAGDDIVLAIDPGMAFGTGQHHSTAMCLQATEDLCSQNAVQAWKVLDVGTGTGILGIAAIRLGAENVVALDIDDQAVAIAVENAILNQVAEQMEIRNRNLSSLRQKFNLILANLTAKTLLELAYDLESLLAPGGYLVISGIIEKQSPEIEDRFSQSPLSLWRTLKSEEWRCYVIKKE